MLYWLTRRVHPSFVLVCLAVGVVLGVFLGVFWRVWWFGAPVWLVAAGVLVGICFLRCRWVVLLLAIIAGVILGGWRTAGMVGDVGYIESFVGQEVEVSGVVAEDLDVDGGNVKLRLDGLVFGGEVAVEGKLFVTMSTRVGGEIERSDRVVLVGKIGEGFGSFAGSMWRPKVVEVAKPEPPDVALRLRNGFSEGVREYISEPEVDLGLGYLLGMKRALPVDTAEMLRVVGLTHIVVASGYNLSVLVRAARRVFGKISRFAALLFGLLLVVSFVGVTGLTPSMVRAGLVAGLSLLVWYFGRKFHPVKLLGLVAAATLLYNPMYVMDLGWLLSFASFAGVMLLAPIITAYFYGTEKKPNFIAQVLVETLSAQICCLPLLLYFFGSFSLVSVVANMLVLPTIPFVMLSVFLTGVVAGWSLIAGLLGTVSEWVLWYHLQVVDIFGGMTEFLVSVPTENPLMFLIYVPIVGLAGYAWRKSGISLVATNVVE